MKAVGPLTTCCYQEATDIMNDSSKSGRWVAYLIKSLDDYIIAEADKKLGDHVKGLSIFNKAHPHLKKTLIFWRRHHQSRQ